MLGRRSRTRPLRTLAPVALDEAEQRVRAALEVDAHVYDIHRLLLERGTAWRPAERPASVTVGARHDAFRNAFRLAREEDGLRYCEGFSLPRGYDLAPNRHAWCLDADDVVVDPSPGWAEPGRPLRDCYFGVVIGLDLAEQYSDADGPTPPKGVLYELTGRADRLAAHLGI